MKHETSKETLVFAARRPPFPLDNGSRIRTHRLVRGLSQAFATTFITFAHHPESPDGHVGSDDLGQLLPDVDIVTVPGLGPGKRGGQLRSLASRRSWEVGRYRRPAFSAALKAEISRRHPAVVHFDDAGVGQFGPLGTGLNAIATHNVDYRIARETATAARGVRRVYGEVECRKLQREERRVWRSMPLCLAVSEVDAEQIRAAGARRVELCPNGADPVGPLPVPRRAPEEGLRVLFVGSGAFQPYERGLAWFIAEVLPKVRRALPVQFDVVGQRPRRPVAAEGVRYVGFVESVAPWYDRSHVVVVPVFQGSGTRLKMIEAMAYGRPVVSTRLGAEGLPIRAGDHYLEADDPDAFARALIAVARRCESAEDSFGQWLTAAREAIAPLFWPNIVARLADLYRAEMERLSRVALSTGRQAGRRGAG